MSSFNLNADALIVIVNALLWSAHDTRLPEKERLIYQQLADKLATITVPLLKENNETDDNNNLADSTIIPITRWAETPKTDNDNNNNAS